MFELELVAGQSLWALGEDDDGSHIDDEWVIVGETGELELAAGAPGGKTAPSITIEYAAEVEP